VIDWAAMIVPSKSDDDPKVAEEPTCQNTFVALALPLRMTRRAVVVISVVVI